MSEAEEMLTVMAKAKADEVAGRLSQYIFRSGQMWDVFQEMVDPWRRELRRARKQLSRVGA